MTPPDWTLPSDDAIRRILVQRIDAEAGGVGLVVGIIDAAQSRVVAHGRASLDVVRGLDGDTVFEIGSVTKVFTALALAEMAGRGEVGLNDPVEVGGREVTLADLATHTSGLPRDPGNLIPSDPANPYRDYTAEQMLAAAATSDLLHPPGSAYLYSNLGAGLLGHVLAARAGADFEGLIRSRITGPLGMGSTAIALTPSMQARMAMGHDTARSPTSPWDLPAIAGAGALRSTANDLLTFLAAMLGFTPSPLRAAIEAQLATRRPTDWPERQIALGWMIARVGGRTVISHNGGTGGFRSFVGFDPERGLGVVVLGNAALWRDDDIGLHLLTGRALAPAPLARASVTLPIEALERLVGRYRFSETSGAEVLRRGERLFMRLTGRRQAFEIHAESETEFFVTFVDAQMIFTLDEAGAATGFIARQDGRDRLAVRLP